MTNVAQTTLPTQSRQVPVDVSALLQELATVSSLDELQPQSRRTPAKALGFSVANVNLLCRMLDAGSIGQAFVLCSRYFQAASKEIYAVAETELPKRGAKLLASRSHAKIMLVDTGKGQWTFESSANARSCVCIEQATLCNDPELFHFHANWFDHVLSQEITPND